VLAGQVTLTGALLRRSEDVARRVPDHPAVTAALERAQAFETHYQGDLSTTLALRVSARAGFLAAGDVRNASIEASNIGCVQILLGALGEAEPALRSALADADRLGLPGYRRQWQHDLGLCIALQGKFAEGIALEEEAAAQARESGSRLYEMSSRAYLARIAFLAGDLGRAERESRSILEEPAALAHQRAYAFTVLSYAVAAQGRPAEALAAAQQAMAFLAADGELEEGESFIRLAHAEALLAVGDADGAAAALAEARARLLDRAGKIADAGLRRSFLERVPENARILALAAER
jgi:hypothetical protein